ncbi:KTSC domain-containing protein [Pedobacter sp. MC2016-05]|uniref:KTSC domain-containing protein n=1 Tax=Pedobacter sp. MC2016-05 TaxID=2994474 RepID=UPI0022471B9B|nr:KTSC domain-containing protein [Pedobacter sp. MC2016-05]MCX2474539.1 KTSC domain-containing protein [Pedobacter sp. MC2016-05]
MPSSVIDHLSYNPEAKALNITFVSGMVYQYEGVPQKVFEMFKAARSKGKYFNYYIKEHYSFKKLANA